MSPKTGHVQILSGQSESEPIQLVSETLVGIYMPSQWDSADLGFSASHDGTTFMDMYDFGSSMVTQADASQFVPVDYTKFVGAAYVKIKSVSGGSPVNQTADRVLTPVFRVLE